MPMIATFAAGCRLVGYEWTPRPKVGAYQVKE